MKLNKKQKRTATIASMAALLAVVLGMGGQTFAKYITTHETADTATVAKWGVVASTNVTNFFSTNYLDGKVSVTPADTDDVVSASATANVVAPGSSGEMTFLVTGKPEVASKVTLEATGDDVSIDWAVADDPDTTNSEAASGTYYPIVWTLSTAGGAPVTGTLAEVKTAINGLTAEFKANEKISFEYKLSWVWDFDDNGAGTNDYKDTALGNAAYNKYKTASETEVEVDPNTDDRETYSNAKVDLSFGLTIKVEQIQAQA